MSDHAAHGHGHQAPDHVPHVTPLYVYLATWGTLVFLTAVTVGASYLNFGAWNLILALAIATIKAGVVAALFMHLLHDSKFHALILISGGLFLTIFVAFTMFDTEFRGRNSADKGERPADITRPFDGTKSQMLMKEKFAHGEHPAAGVASGGAEPAHPEGVASAQAEGTAHAEHPAASASESAAPAVSGSAMPSASAMASGSAMPSAVPSASAKASAAPAKSAHP